MMTKGQLIGVDLGRPGGDQSAFRVRCPNCQRLYTGTWDSRVCVHLRWIECVCGVRTSVEVTQDEPTCSACGKPWSGTMISNVADRAVCTHCGTTWHALNRSENSV